MSKVYFTITDVNLYADSKEYLYIKSEVREEQKRGNWTEVKVIITNGFEVPIADVFVKDLLDLKANMTRVVLSEDKDDKPYAIQVAAIQGELYEICDRHHVEGEKEVQFFNCSGTIVCLESDVVPMFCSNCIPGTMKQP